MSGDIFFLLSRDHRILGQFIDISDARSALHEIDAGQYVARLDGTVMAYMSREGQSWRPIAKVPPEFRPALHAHVRLESIANSCMDS